MVLQIYSQEKNYSILLKCTSYYSDINEIFIDSVHNVNPIYNDDKWSSSQKVNFEKLTLDDETYGSYENIKAPIDVSYKLIEG